jgi:hypothetical protein
VWSKSTTAIPSLLVIDTLPISEPVTSNEVKLSLSVIVRSPVVTSKSIEAKLARVSNVKLS